MQAQYLSVLQHADKPSTDRILGSASTVLMGYQLGGKIPPSALAWASYRRFSRDLGRQSFPSVHLVMYDPEAWHKTPIDEQQHPVVFMERFARLARRYGFQVMLTPNPNLMTVSGGDCVAGTGETLVHAYVRCGISGSAARVADVVETQAQALESSPAAYRAFVEQTAAQADAANPHVKVIRARDHTGCSGDVFGVGLGSRHRGRVLPIRWK